MRMMLLTAALLAAEADFGAAAPAGPEANVQASAPEQPPVDNDHVAPGCEQFYAPASEAPAPSSSSSSSEESAAMAQATKNAEAALVGSHNTAGGVSHDTRPAPMGAPVLVRQGGKLAPGVVVEEDDGNGSGITVQIFRGDHLPHVGHHLQRTTANDTSDGWFYPWERRSL